jgi:hypothetical protein
VYYNTDRIVTLKNEEQEPYIDTFNGAQHADIEMELKIDIGPSSSFSESLMMSSLDKLHDKGEINTIQYLKYVPNDVAPYKDRLIKELQQQMEQQAAMQQQQAQAQAMQAQQPNPNDPHPFDQLLAQLPKHEQEAFRKAPPEQQQAVMQAMQGQPG